MPINNELSIKMMGKPVPTAASALSPMTFPTTTLSTMLYSCWKMLPSNSGMVKFKISRYGLPLVMSIEVVFFSFAINPFLSFSFVPPYCGIVK